MAGRNASAMRPDVDLFHQHRPEQARAQAVQDRRNAEHRVIAVAREQAPDKVGHKADQRAGDRPEEHARDEDRHGLEREARRLIRHRDDEPRQHDRDGREQGGRGKDADIFQTGMLRGRAQRLLDF